MVTELEEEVLVKVIGVGDEGNRVVEKMSKKGMSCTEFIAVNTNVQTLSELQVPIKIQVDRNLTEEESKIRKVLEGSLMVFVIVAGMESVTGIDIVSIVAKIAKDMRIVTVGIFIYPSDFEKRKKHGYEEVSTLREFVDTVIMVPSQELLTANDDFIYQVIKGITELFTKPGLINLDFADVRAVMSNSAYASVGIGKASGKDKALRAGREAINSPLLKDFWIEEAKYILLHIRGGEDLTIDEASELARLIKERAKRNNTNYFFAINISEELEDSIEVTIIAIGSDENGKPIPRFTARN